ncbi:hypothetical protein [Micromonospora zingiberis]|nr:hypothetical protein [Micromonospora zingiberis]
MFALPLAIVARRPRGMVLAMIVHGTVNTLTFAALLAGLAQR